MLATTQMQELQSPFGSTRPAADARSYSFTAVASENRDYEWLRVVRRIHGMQALRDDWDGLGAIAPSLETIRQALLLAEVKWRTNDYAAPTRVVASPAGTIVLEWQQGSTYTEAEVAEENRSEWMQIAPGSPAKHWTECERYESVDPDYTPQVKDLPTVYWANPTPYARSA